MRSCGGRVVTSSPKKRTLPLRGGKSPMMALNSVVLPAPLAPSTARRSPGRRVKLTLSRATSAPKWQLTPSISGARADAPCAMRWALSDTLSCSIAFRVVAANRADRHELGAVHVERLVDARDDLDNLVVEAAVRALGHFGDEVRPDRLPVLVQPDLADRSIDGRRGQPLAQLRLIVCEVALSGVPPL